ncbi:MAG TPA: ABC transporter permease [Nocardioidaceae bacterium]|nr:ABC transporter permease [Nocardioidaceae bacterium]
MTDHPTGFVVDESRVPDAPLIAPSANGGLRSVFKRRYLLSLLVKRELAARYQGTVLGLFWSYVQPLTRFAMYFFVVGIVLGLHGDVENFGIHMFSAFVFVHYFTEVFAAGTRSVVRNKSLVQKMAMPREMFPVASVLVSGYHTLPSMVILMVACIFTGWSPDGVGILAGLLGFAIMTVLGTGLALLFSALNVYFRDFQNIVGTLTAFVHFSVPMIYPYERVTNALDGGWLQLYLANPLTESVMLIQRFFWVGTTDDPDATITKSMPDDLFQRGFIMLGICLLFLAMAQWAFTKLESKFPERL